MSKGGQLSSHRNIKIELTIISAGSSIDLLVQTFWNLRMPTFFLLHLLPVIQDTTAFKNIAYSSQGDSQLNIEYGAVIFKGLTMTIILYSNSPILNMPLHSQSDIQILNFPLSWNDDNAECCGLHSLQRMGWPTNHLVSLDCHRGP